MHFLVLLALSVLHLCPDRLTYPFPRSNTNSRLCEELCFLEEQVRLLHPGPQNDSRSPPLGFILVMPTCFAPPRLIPRCLAGAFSRNLSVKALVFGASGLVQTGGYRAARLYLARCSDDVPHRLPLSLVLHIATPECVRRSSSGLSTSSLESNRPLLQDGDDPRKRWDFLFQVAGIWHTIGRSEHCTFARSPECDYFGGAAKFSCPAQRMPASWAEMQPRMFLPARTRILPSSDLASFKSTSFVFASCES